VLHKIKQIIKQKNIVWRSFWNGGTRGPISREWQVRTWPTIYVIDANGVIRYKGVKGPTMDKAVDTLLAEVAKADTKE